MYYTQAPLPHTGPFAAAQYAGTSKHKHCWTAVIKACDHGAMLWAGTEVHRNATDAIAKAEVELARREDA